MPKSDSKATKKLNRAVEHPTWFQISNPWTPYEISKREVDLYAYVKDRWDQRHQNLIKFWSDDIEEDDKKSLGKLETHLMSGKQGDVKDKGSHLGWRQVGTEKRH